MLLINNTDEVKLLAPIVDEYFHCDQYVPLMENITCDFLYPEDTLIEFFSYIIIASPLDLRAMIELFFDIPYEKMPDFTTLRPVETLPRALSLCPPAEAGPYPWQAILAKWRLHVLGY
jgi:hypothetical protein